MSLCVLSQQTWTYNPNGDTHCRPNLRQRCMTYSSYKDTHMHMHTQRNAAYEWGYVLYSAYFEILYS